MVPLSSLVRIETDAAPAAIEQFNQLNSATISALPLPGVTTSEGLKVLRRHRGGGHADGLLSKTSPASHDLRLQEGSSIALAFGLAVIVIYLVLAAQFESFRDPLHHHDVGAAVAFRRADASLNMGLATLNIYTEVGLITLVGLITKHGILMVEFANDLQAKKRSRRGERP